MGRASSQQHRVAATPLATRRGADPTRLHLDRDRLWLSSGEDLVAVCELMHRGQNLTRAEAEQVAELMGRLGREVGLTQRWAVLHRNDQVLLAYLRGLAEGLPAGPHAGEYDSLEDEFDGRLIDGLPEARYLGRRLQELAEVHGRTADRLEPAV